MFRACQTSFSFLSEDQTTVRTNKKTKAYLHIINYFIIDKGLFWSLTCTSLLWTWSLASLLLLLWRTLRDEGALSDGSCVFWGRTAATFQPMKPRTPQMNSVSFMGGCTILLCQTCRPISLLCLLHIPVLLAHIPTPCEFLHMSATAEVLFN